MECFYFRFANVWVTEKFNLFLVVLKVTAMLKVISFDLVEIYRCFQVLLEKFLSFE